MSWMIPRDEPCWKILGSVRQPLLAVMHALPVETPRLLVVSAIDDLVAAACRLEADSPGRHLRSHDVGARL